MRIAKKITGILTVMVCAAGTVWGGSSLIAGAETYGEQAGYGDYLYYQTVDEDEDGTDDFVKITDCDESATEAEIPAEIEGLPVTVIDNGAFAYCSDLINVTIPEGITSIGGYAFFRCTSLTSVTIPNGVTVIGGNAFNGCINLSDITIPECVTEIIDFAFEDCTSLVSVTIPESVELIGWGAFFSCLNLEEITIKNPECVIDGSVLCNYSDENSYCYNGIIYGYTNSTAQAYAEECGYDFVSIGEYSPETIPGDISGNGKIDLYDAIEICKSIMGMRTFTDEEQAIADYDGNGKVDLYDAIGIAKKLLEK